MANMTVDYICARFDEIVGWPYASPGSNDERGIDCSGAFVRAYRIAGKSIYHGSNRIERVYCRDCFDLNGSTAGLVRGMAAFKFRNPGETGYDDSPLSSDYLPGGKYYNGDVRNYTHIGLVTSVNPLGITNATSPNARVDTKLGSGVTAWRRAGYLTAVIYSTTGGNESDDENGGEIEMNETAKVIASSGSTVNMRKTPSKSGDLVARVPIGSLVLIQSVSGEWASVYWDTGEKPYAGYMMTEFLAIQSQDDEATGEGTDAGSGETSTSAYEVCIPCDTLEQAETLVRLLGRASVGAG